MDIECNILELYILNVYQTFAIFRCQICVMRTGCKSEQSCKIYIRRRFRTSDGKSGDGVTFSVKAASERIDGNRFLLSVDLCLNRMTDGQPVTAGQGNVAGEGKPDILPVYIIVHRFCDIAKLRFRADKIRLVLCSLTAVKYRYISSGIGGLVLISGFILCNLQGFLICFASC